MNKAGIANRLSKLGLRPAAEAYKEEVRQRLKAAGEDRDVANNKAWEAMWDEFRPVVERLERASDGETHLAGRTDDVDQFLDTNYNETDPGKRLRDGLIWVAEEIRRVVTDSDDGTSVNLARAKTPPPSAWAVFCLEGFAAKPPAKRLELIAKVLPFATRSHDARSGDAAADNNGFLEDVG